MPLSIPGGDVFKNAAQTFTQTNTFNNLATGGGNAITVFALSTVPGAIGLQMSIAETADMAINVDGGVAFGTNLFRLTNTTLTIGTELSAGGSVGTSGQVLKSRGAGLSPQWGDAAGGSGSALPTWTFSAAGGDPTAGQFKTDNADPASTTAIRIHGTNVGTGTGFDAYLNTVLAPVAGMKNRLTLTNTTTQEQSYFVVDTVADSGTFATITGTFVASTESAWSGTYALDWFLCPTAQLVYSVNENVPNEFGAITLSAFSGSALTSVDVAYGVVTNGS